MTQLEAGSGAAAQEETDRQEMNKLLKEIEQGAQDTREGDRS